MRIVFMGTPAFAVPALEAVAGAFTVVGVYTQPDKPVGRGLEVQSSAVKRKAQELSLPVFQPEKLTLPGEFEKLAALVPDIIVVVAYGQILKKEVLELPRLGCVNIHSSLLPRWRGAAPIHWALMSGDTETGVTTMHLVEKLDAGDILLQVKTPITPEDTTSTLHDRLAVLGAQLIAPTLEGLERGGLQARRQDETAVTYAKKLTKEMENLKLSEGAVQLDRQIRALNPWPGTSVTLTTGERLKIKKVKLHRNIDDIQGIQRAPAPRIYEKAGMVLLGTGQGALELLSVQWDGKKEVDAPGFLNGLKGQGKALPLALK